MTDIVIAIFYIAKNNVNKRMLSVKPDINKRMLSVKSDADQASKRKYIKQFILAMSLNANFHSLKQIIHLLIRTHLLNLY